MRHFILGFISLSVLGAFSLNGCVEKVGDDCTFTQTCPLDGGSSGDGDTGGTSSTGGNGTGAGDTGGTGGEMKPACDPACGADTPVCDEAAKECVGCLKDGDCDGDTPLCDTDANKCIGCEENVDCSDATASLCDSQSCAPCAVDDDCSHIEGKIFVMMALASNARAKRIATTTSAIPQTTPAPTFPLTTFSRAKSASMTRNAR